MVVEQLGFSSDDDFQDFEDFGDHPSPPATPAHKATAREQLQNLNIDKKKQKQVLKSHNPNHEGLLIQKISKSPKKADP